MGALTLDREQAEKDHHSGGQDVGLQAGRYNAGSFQRRQDRDRRRDHAVAVDQRGAEQPGEHDEGATPAPDAEKRHQRQDAALALIVDAHRHADVFHRGNDDQRPHDEGQGAQRRLRIGMRTGHVEHGLEGIERAGADIAEHHTERGQAHRRQAARRNRRGRGGRHRHIGRALVNGLLPRCPQAGTASKHIFVLASSDISPSLLRKSASSI